MAGSSGVFWIGADGNGYVKGPNGVQNYGKVSASSANGFEGALGSVQAKQINDPNPPQQSNTPNDTGGGYGSNNVSAGNGGVGGGAASIAGPVYADKSNDIALQNAGLGAVDSQTQGAIDKINASLAAVLGGYDAETGANTKNYSDQSNNNQNQLQTGKQTALVNAANGRRGLLGTLGSIGGLSEDSMRLANDAVQHGANEDLSGAGQTYASNQSGLDTAFNTYSAADKSRRDRANNAAADDSQNARNSGANAKQTFYTNLSNDYAAQGDKANSSKYSGMAASLYPEIAATNVPARTIAPETAAYTPSTLASYLAKGNTLVQTTAPAQTGGLMAPGLTATTKKQQQSPVGMGI